jgi:hypothetical protein
LKEVRLGDLRIEALVGFEVLVPLFLGNVYNNVLIIVNVCDFYEEP